MRTLYAHGEKAEPEGPALHQPIRVAMWFGFQAFEP